MAQQLKHSSVLFTEENGSPLEFVLRPCIQKKTLRPLIEHGGGVLTSAWSKKAIRLAVPGDSNISSEDYVSSRYIEDCVKENKLLDMNLYKMNKKPDVCTMDDMEHASVIFKTTARDRKGRKKFTLSEDKEIIKYLMEERRFTEMKGNAVWKDMEILKITDHTSQSMKDRFKKQILPNIHSYSIPLSWISALTGVTSDARSSPVAGTSKPPFSGFSDPFPSLEKMTTRSTNRHYSPLPFTSDKNVEHSQNHNNKSNSPFKNPTNCDKSKLADEPLEMVDQSEDKGENNQLKRSAVDQSSSRIQTDSNKAKEIQSSQSPDEAVEMMDQSENRTACKQKKINSPTTTDASDEDEFDKELLRMADKSGVLDIIQTDTQVVTLSIKESYVPLKDIEGNEHKGLSSSRKSARLSEKKNLSNSGLSSSEDKPAPVKDLLHIKTRKHLEFCDDNIKDSLPGSPKSFSSPKVNRKRKSTSPEPAESSPSPNKTTSSHQKQPSNHSPRKEVQVNARVGRSCRNKVPVIDDDSDNTNDDEGPGTSSSHTGLTKFVMDIDNLASSPEPQMSAEDDSVSETDLENSAGPDEVKKHCKIVKRLCSIYELTPAEVLSALWANSGSLRNTIHWFRYGVDESGCPPWTEEDDARLESSRSEDINLLRRKYGPQRVNQRAAFLEDSSLK